MATVYDNGTQSSAAAIDGKFPDWRRVLPEKPSGEIAQFNSEYIGDFGKMATVLDHHTPFAFIEHSGLSAARVTIPGHPDFMGVLMPYDTKGHAPATAVSEFTK